MGPTGKALLSTAAVLGLSLYAAAARPPSRPSTPGSQQTSATPAASQATPTPNATQSVRTPNAEQSAPRPNQFFGGVEPSQPQAVSTFTVPGSTLTVRQFSAQGVIVSSFPPGARVFLPLEMQ